MSIREVGGFCYQGTAFFDAEFVQSLDSTVLNRHVAPVDGWGLRSLNQSLNGPRSTTVANAFNASINALVKR